MIPFAIVFGRETAMRAFLTRLRGLSRLKARTSRLGLTISVLIRLTMSQLLRALITGLHPIPKVSFSEEKMTFLLRIKTPS